MANDSAADLKSDALHFHASRGPASSRSRRPSRSPTSATSRSPIRPASPSPARRSRPIPTRPPIYTARQNLVAVLTNGTAVLGLGAIGPLAGKPVMEGKAVLFKKFAGIDVFDIEVAETERRQARRHHRRAGADLRRHQSRGHQGPGMFRGRGEGEGPHGHSRSSTTTSTAPRSSSPPRSPTRWSSTGKTIDEVKIVCSGAGAAALASLNLLVSLGARRENIFVCDIEGVVYKGREKLMDRWKAAYAQETERAHARPTSSTAPTSSSAFPPAAC